MEGIKFKRIALQGWRQFDNIEIDLHERLTIVTGANGAGKSSILKAFSKHFGLELPFLSTPVLVEGRFVYKTGLFISLTKKISSFFKKENHSTVGKISYTNKTESSLTVQESDSAQYLLQINGMQGISGIHIDSHQIISNYRQVANIPSSMTSPSAAYDLYHNEINNRYHGGHTGYSPLYRMKEAIISMAVFGEGNSRNQGNPELQLALSGFINVLHKVLPASLGFIDLSVRTPEVVLQTKTGEFLLDAASGGVSTLIDLAWRLHMFSLKNESFVVTMDEPENHLHPSMQRSLMQRLLSAFPKVQFIVATHSPFIISSVKDSYVYVLRYNTEDRVVDGFAPETTKSRVISEKLDTVNKASSANEILREVLGVEATTPEWVSEELSIITKKYKNLEITKETLENIRAELKNLGFSDHYPLALAELMKGK
ncbi:MAG TPA: AAA family ATPase [Pseudomonas sp.]|nr:AAA family ATPase [Pseudomonas sp.]